MIGDGDADRAVEVAQKTLSANMELGGSAQRGIGLVPEGNEATDSSPASQVIQRAVQEVLGTRSTESTA